MMAALGAEGRRFESCLPDHKTTDFCQFSHATGEAVEPENGTNRIRLEASGTANHGIVTEVVRRSFSRVLVCGGRDFNDRRLLMGAMDALDAELGKFWVVIHGNARGADLGAATWAMARGRQHMPFPANWSQHGKAAGPMRNQRMLDEGKPDLVVAFPGGRGTADIVRRAHKAGVEVREIFPASVGAHPKGGDNLLAPFMGDAVREAQTPNLPSLSPSIEDERMGDGK